MKSITFAAILFTFLAAGMAKAEDAAGPCKADAEKFCKDIKPGDGRFLACLETHKAELSEACKAKRLEAKKKVLPLPESCKGDLKKFCAEAKDGQGGKLLCLKGREKDLSEGCRAEFAQRREEMLKNNPCQPDMEKFCKDVKPGKGGMIKCLKAHEAELSESCSAQHEKMKNREGKKGRGKTKQGKGAGRP